EWGDVVLLELAACSETGPIAQPLLLADVLGCWTRTTDAAEEIAARLETFEDTIPGLVKIETNPALFPDQSPVTSQEPLPLESEATNAGPDSASGESPRRDANALDKISGGLSMLCVRARAGALELEALERLLGMASSDSGASTASGNLATHVYRVLRPENEGSGDIRIFAE